MSQKISARKVLLAKPTGKQPRGRPRTMRRDFISDQARSQKYNRGYKQQLSFNVKFFMPLVLKALFIKSAFVSAVVFLNNCIQLYACE